MNRSSRTQTLVTLVVAATLATGCGGTPGKVSASRYAAAAHAQAAAASAKAAIEALASKLGALTTTPPAATTAATTATATTAATTAATTTTTVATTPAAPSAGLLNVPSAGAAFSSLRAAASSPAAAPSSANLSGALASANAALGGALSQLDVSKQCALIPTAQVQALVKGTVGAAANAPLQCGWKGTDLQVSIRPHDNDVHGTDILNAAGAHDIAGLGDEAKWEAPVAGATVPNVFARKGTLTCYVQAPDVSQSTIPHSGTDPFFKISDAASAGYAALEGKLCADVFAGS